MKRSFVPPARQALCVLVGALACGAACTPNQGVKPGAPELIEFTIVQAGPTVTTVTSTTPACVSGIASGDACLPMGRASGADGGTDTPADALCQDVADNNWCTCVADGTDDTMGTWSCAPFTNVMAVIAVFDRLLDTAPLDPGDAAGLVSVVTTTASAGAPTIELLSNYSSTGDPNGLIFNKIFGPLFGNFRGDGPSLYAAPQPEFPSDATVTVNLDATMVRAKDGTTPFVGTGLLQGGTLVFTMAPFAATVVPPDPPTMDMPDPPIAVTIAFTNFADNAGCGPPNAVDPTMSPPPCVTLPHITVTANGAPVAVDVTSADGSAMSIAPPKSGPWPAGATIVVSIDATTVNLLGQPIAAAATATFTAR
jgi:hypothetical protein